MCLPHQNIIRDLYLFCYFLSLQSLERYLIHRNWSKTLIIHFYSFLICVYGEHKWLDSSWPGDSQANVTKGKEIKGDEVSFRELLNWEITESVIRRKMYIGRGWWIECHRIESLWNLLILCMRKPQTTVILPC